MLRGFVYAFSMHKWKISAIFEHAGELLATQYFHVRTDTSYDRLEFHENISTVERKHAKEHTLFFCCYMPISWYWSFCCENRNQANHSLKVKFCNRISSINIDWVREFTWRSRNLWMQKKEQPNQNGWTVDRRAQRLHTNTHKWASLASNVLRTRCHVEHWHFAWILVTQHESKCYLMHHNFLLAMRNGIRHRALLQMKQACWIYHLVVFFVFRWLVHTMLVPEWIERVPKSLSEFDSRAQESMKHLHYVIPYCWTSHRIASNLNRSKMLKTIQQQTVKTIYVISCKKEEKLVKLVGFALIRICCVYLVINFHVIRPAISFETRSRCVLDIAEHKIGVNKSQASA